MKMKNTRALIVALALAGTASPGFPQTMTTASITGIRTGWGSDSFAITTKEPIKNPAHCATPDGYISDKTLPGYTTHYDAALTAFTWWPKVVVAIHNSACFVGRPVLIGIYLNTKLLQNA